MKQLFLGVLFTGLLASALGKTCVWTEHAGSAMLYGLPISTSPVADEDACKTLCENSPTCELAEFCEVTGVCRLFSFDYTEAVLLEYSQRVDGKVLFECTPVEFCSCSLIGDPVVKAFDQASAGSTFKITTNGVYNMASTNLGIPCDITTTVTTAAPDPGKPNRSVVTHLTVQVGSQTVEVTHTPLQDEVAGIKVNGNTVVLPNPNPDPMLFVTEHSGAVFIRFEDCPVSLTFQDFKNSRATITLDSTVYGSGLTGLCGKCGNNGFSFVGDPDSHLL